MSKRQRENIFSLFRENDHFNTQTLEQSIFSPTTTTTTKMRLLRNINVAAATLVNVVLLVGTGVRAEFEPPFVPAEAGCSMV
jgi:hypothetical protein